VSRQSFVIDTNVLLHDPDALSKFPENDVVLPLTVLEELDKMKRLPNELGENARRVIRFLDALKWRGSGDWKEGIKLENDSRLWIQLQEKTKFNGDFALSGGGNANRIVSAAYCLNDKGKKVVFVSKDFGARIKAEAVGLLAEDYRNLKVNHKNVYKGIVYQEAEKGDIDSFFKDGTLDLNGTQCENNEYLVMNSPENSSAVGRANRRTGKIEALLQVPDLWGITPRNVEQKCALDLLLRDDIPLVTLVGQAGTGKTLLALAAALRKVFDEDVYSRILVSRPIMPLGRDIGFLPGTKDEKLSHWMQPIFDNLAFLCDSTDAEPNETLRWVMDSKKLEMEAVTYIRGRTLPKMFIIIDEAQNLSPHEVKTIISRAGAGTKVVLTGDPSQIDNPYLDQDSNGLTFTIGKFQGNPLHGTVLLEKTERSSLAAAAADLM
jgi:PhoH-like ATPase